MYVLEDRKSCKSFTWVRERLSNISLTSSAWDRNGWKVLCCLGSGADRWLYEVEIVANRMMNMNRLIVSRTFRIGQRLLGCHTRHAGQEELRLQQRRSIKTHCRHLAYAKDLFLGQVNKVKEKSCQKASPKLVTGGGSRLRKDFRW